MLFPVYGADGSNTDGFPCGIAQSHEPSIIEMLRLLIHHWPAQVIAQHLDLHRAQEMFRNEHYGSMAPFRITDADIHDLGQIVQLRRLRRLPSTYQAILQIHLIHMAVPLFSMVKIVGESHFSVLLSLASGLTLDFPAASYSVNGTLLDAP